MRVWWYLMCDESHGWEGHADDPSTEAPARLLRCPVCGLEAITARRMPPADRVRVALAPSTCIADSVRAQVAREDRYYVEVRSRDGTEAILSADDFDWEDAVERGSWFRNLTWVEAANRCQRTGLASRSTQ
jgi:hypothetical protein